MDADKLFRAVYPIYQEQERKRSHAEIVRWHLAEVAAIYKRKSLWLSFIAPISEDTVHQPHSRNPAK